MQRGDRIAYLGNNNAEAVECTAAAAKGAFVHVPISFRLSNREVRQILQHSGARILIIETEFAEKLGEIGDCPALERIIRFDPSNAAASPFEAWLVAQADGEPDVDPLADDNFLIVYTSGTTGCPRECCSSSGNPSPMLRFRSSITTFAPIAACSWSIRTLRRIDQYVLHPRLGGRRDRGDGGCERVRGGAVAVAGGSRKDNALPPGAHDAHPRARQRHSKAASICRACRRSATDRAAMPRERIEQLHKTFGSILVQGYGMTEVSSLAAVLTKADHAKALTGDGRQLSACGRPVFGCELRVVDENGRPVPNGEIGEIVFRSPQVTSGYWCDTDRTQAAIQNDWLHSGDLATIDSEGYIYIVDRKSDIIISGGFNVSSKEVEEIIGWHPSVREAAVVARLMRNGGRRCMPSSSSSLAPGWRRRN